MADLRSPRRADVSVGPAEEADASLAAILVARIVAEDLGDPPMPVPAVPQGCAFLVARKDGRLVGGLLVRKDAGAGCVDWWAVERDERGSGIGRELLTQAEAWCQGEGLSLLRVRTLAAVPTALRLLWTRGFCVSSLAVTEEGETVREAVYFEKRVTAEEAARPN